MKQQSINHEWDAWIDQSLGFDFSQFWVMFTIILGHGRQEDQSYKPEESSSNDAWAEDGQEFVDGQKEYERYQKLNIMPGDPETFVGSHFFGLE